MTENRKEIILHGNGSANEYKKIQRRSLAHSELQPTGFYVISGQEIMVNVEGETDGSVNAVIGVPELNKPEKHLLTTGLNKFTSKNEGLLSFTNNNNHGYVKIIIQSELQKIPSFKLNETNNTDWENMMASYSDAPVVQLSSERAIIVVRYNSAKKYLTDPNALMKYYDDFIRFQDNISGILEDGKADYKVDPNKLLYVEADRLYMFATNGHMGFNGAAALQRLLTTNNGWGIWHESGHQRQQSPYTWSGGTGMTEVTVNLYSLAVQEGFHDRASFIDKYYPKIKEYLVTEEKNFDAQDINIKLGMLWQLRLTFGNGFYPQLHQAYRLMDSLPVSNDDKKQQLIISSSQLTNINLAAFFDKWGITPNEKTLEILKTLPPLEKNIWENDDKNSITIEMPQQKYVPELAYFMKSIKKTLLSENKFEFTIDLDWHTPYQYVIKKNNQYLAEIREGKPFYCSAKLDENGLNVKVSHDFALDDSIEIEVRFDGGKYAIYTMTVYDFKLWERLNNLFKDQDHTEIADNVTQNELDDIFEAIKHANDSEKMSFVFHRAQEMFLINTVISINIDSDRLTVNFKDELFKNYKYVATKDNKYISEINKGKAYYSSFIPPLKWVTNKKLNDASELAIQARLSNGTYVIFETTFAEENIKQRIAGLYTDASQSKINDNVTQSTLSELIKDINDSEISYKKKDIYLSQVDDAQLMFLKQTIAQVELAKNKFIVTFANENFRDNKYVSIKNGTYQSEVNQGKPAYSSLSNKVWSTNMTLTEGDHCTIEVRMGPKVYVIYQTGDLILAE
ncbi:M60 family metallopeptidase [Photorhabdus asymbiotica]|uniref:M60 family metallopeptidase n=1 Tax=Photorhabdus asymbiotica TaxID=291112 RepID=UPI003DA6E1B3